MVKAISVVVFLIEVGRLSAIVISRCKVHFKVVIVNPRCCIPCTSRYVVILIVIVLICIRSCNSCCCSYTHTITQGNYATPQLDPSVTAPLSILDLVGQLPIHSNIPFCKTSLPENHIQVPVPLLHDYTLKAQISPVVDFLCQVHINPKHHY